MKKKYQIRKTLTAPELGQDWIKPPWDKANIMQINEVRKESSDHHPQTELKLLYNNRFLFGMFRVKDKFVKAVHNGFQSSVSKDSCVEFFIKTKPGGGYFNFEFNCSGVMLCFYIVDPTRVPEEKQKTFKTPKEFVDYTPLSIADLESVDIYHSLPEKIDPEISEPTEWFLSFKIPFNLLEKYAGSLGDLSGNTWEANCYKCGSETSHPHWLSWNPIKEKDFHLPECFGELIFE